MSKVLHEEKPEGKRDEADEDALLEDLLDDISFDDGDAEVEVSPDLAPGTSEPAIAAKPPSAKLVMLRNKIAEPGFDVGKTRMEDVRLCSRSGSCVVNYAVFSHTNSRASY